MRRLLIAIQLVFLALIILLAWVLLFYQFGSSELQMEKNASSPVNAQVANLEQLRAWSDLIVSRTLFSPRRGQAKAAAGEVWAKESPPFRLVAIYSDANGLAAIFIPADADPNVTMGVTLRNGQQLMEKVSIVEIRPASVLVRKEDGLFEMRLARSAGDGALKLTEAK